MWNTKPEMWQRLWLPLSVLILLALVPYGWVAEWQPQVRRAVNLLFQSEWSHVVGHFLLYGALATAVLLAIPRLRRHPVIFVTLMLALGVAQEGLQLVTFKHRAFGLPELFDLAVDVAGALTALWLLRRL